MVIRSMLASLWLAASVVAQPALVSARPDLETLAALERKFRAAADRVTPATVGLRVGGAQGSGVIVTADGFVLTAAHVFSRPGQRARIMFPDGRTVSGACLGKNVAADFGLIRITESTAEPWPHVPMGRSDALETGALCLATGHPGGFESGRPPVLRLGRVTSLRGSFVRTTCAIDHGDSGGPLFDLQGCVIGVHSRIRDRVTSNFHVPIDRVRNAWDRLVAGEVWGFDDRAFGRGPVLGVRARTRPEGGCIVERVYDDLPASAAGIRRGDILLAFDGTTILSIEHLQDLVGARAVGDRVVIGYLRDGESHEVTVELTRVGRRR